MPWTRPARYSERVADLHLEPLSA
ncbi:MAG: hypothetical protein QOI90_1546, partial [Mycobacterium sp.]|nr:hypothetical protein [Mycobacterium sp.]